MNKKILTFFLLGLMMFSVVPSVSAFFFKDHTYFVLKGFEEVDSPITARCRPYIEQVLNGDWGSDIPVTHYFDKKVTSYIFTHQRAAYLTCQEEAGGDDELFCFCVGSALHQVQDINSHGTDGLVVNYLKKYGSSNMLGHMVIERSFEKQNQESLANDPLVNQVNYWDDKVLDLMFEETGGDVKYLEMLEEMSGINMVQDAKVIRSGYQGEGFYDAVYKDKVSLPFWGWAIGILFILFGIGATVLILWLGKTNWKFLAVIFWIILAILGAIIIYSFISGTTWQITTFLIEQPAKLGYLKVSQADITLYNQRVQASTNEFLKTGNLNVDDASGLSFVDRNGVYHEGALDKASSTFKYIVLPIITVIFTIFQSFLIFKSFKKKKK